jgi:ankyrin repeat protein
VTDVSSSMTCEAALQAFNNNSSSTSEILRKRVELIDTIQELSLPSAPSSGSSEYHLGLVVALVLCSLLFVLPWVVLLRQHAKSFLSSSFKFLTKRRTLLSENKDHDARDEKEEDFLNHDIHGGSTTSISVQDGPSFVGSLNRRNTSRTLRVERDIWTAAVQGASDVVEELFYSPNAPGIDSVHPKFGTLLSAAARSGNKRLVNRILQWKPKLAVKGGHYHTALQSAAHSGNLDIVTTLLANGAPVGSVGGYYGTALNAAAEKGSLEMLQTLLEKDAAPKHTVNVRGGTYGYPIIAAASRGQLDMVKLLISKGADVNAADDSGTIALHTAATGNHIAVVEELLRQGSDYDRVSKVYGTVLHVLTSSEPPSSEQEDIALVLVEGGANITLTDRQLRTPLHEAARTGLERLTLALMNKDDSNVDAVDSGGNTALHHAAIGGHAEIVKQLIAHGIDVSIGDKFKAQALFRAAGCHHPDVVKLLLEARADPNARDCFGRTALHGPAQTEDVSVHSMLLEAGAEVNAIGEDKKTPLHEACNMGRINNVKLLLSKPEVEVNLVDNDNCTALYKALRSTDGHYRDKCIDPKIVDLLLERDDIDVNAAHAIAFQEAARQGMVETVETMLSKRGANIHIQGGEYGGVIQAAAIGGHAEMLELLLSPPWRGNVSAVGGEFGTPLAAAVAFGHFEAARVLLEAGAVVDVKNAGRYSSAFQSVGRRMSGLDPLEKEHRCKELVALLERYAGKSLDYDADMPHLEDRWLQATNGWTFFPKGEL